MGVKDRYQKKKEMDTTKSSYGVKERYDIKKQVGNVDINQEYIDSFIDEANIFLKGTEKSFGDVDYGSATSIYNSKRGEWDSIKDKGNAIKLWLENNRGSFDEESFKDVYDNISAVLSGGQGVVSSFGELKDYYSSFDSELDFKMNEDNINFDSLKEEDILKEIESLEKKYSDSNKYMGNYNNSDEKKQLKEELAYKKTLLERVRNRDIRKKYEAVGLSGTDSYDRAFSSTSGFNKDTLEEMESVLLKRLSTSGDARNNSIFSKKFWQQGKLLYRNLTNLGEYSSATPEIESKYAYMTDEELWNAIQSYRNVNAREVWETYNDPLGDFFASADSTLYDISDDTYMQMTDQERQTYNYWLNRGLSEGVGGQYAFEYGESIRDALTVAKAEEVARSVETNQQELIFAVAAGIENFGEGMESLFNNDTDISSTQVASQIVRENLDGAMGVAYDISQTTGNMLPSILASAIASYVNPAIGGYVGSTLMGASAAGNAKAEMLREGYSQEEAETYGLLIGISEGALQYALGGISKLGSGGISKIASKALSQIDNAFLRFATDYAIKMGREGIEEGLQEIISPIIKSAITGTDNSVDWGQVVYSALLGAMSAGLFEGVETIGSSVALKNLGSQYRTGQADLVQEGIDTGALSKKQGDALLGKIGKGKNLTDTRLGNIAQSVESRKVESDRKKIESAVKSRLESLGEQGDVNSLSKAISRQIVGDELNLRDKYLLFTNDNAKRVIDELNTDGDKVIPSWAKQIGTKYVNPEYYSAEYVEQTTYDSNENEVKIDSITSTKDGAIVVKTDSGATIEVDSLDLGFNDNILMNTVSKLNLNPESATMFYKGFEGSNMSAEAYSRGFTEAYTYGEYSIPQREMSEKGLAMKLDAPTRDIAYKLGQTDAKYKVKLEQEAINKAKQETFDKFKDGKNFNKKGSVYFEEGVNPKELNDRQRVSMSVIEAMAKITGTKIYIYKSLSTVDPNGFFDERDNSLHIDILAGAEQNSLMLYTMSHELTHFIKKWSPQKYKVLTDILMDYYAKEGVSVEELVGEQINKAKANGKTLTFDEAYEEVIADSCEKMLTDKTVLAEISKQIKSKDMTLWQKIKSFFASIIAKIQEVYKGLSPDSNEGKIVSKWLDETTDIQKAWAEALVDAGESFKAIEDGVIQYSESSESFAPSYSIRTWTESEYVQKKKEMAKLISERLGVSISKATKYVDDINSIANIIATDRARLDYEASSFGSAFVSNVEYGGSFDFSTICKKRRLYTGTFSKIQEILKDEALSPDDILEIRNMLIEEKAEATCGLCYVEGSRANMGKFAKEFIRLYKRDNPNSWTPNMADVNTPDGVERMRINHPEVYESYEYFWNHYGKLKDSDPALFASQQKPKLYESRKEYKGEILDNFKKDTTVAQKNRNGGIRMQSFSDFEIVHLIDTMQIIMDMSVVGLSGQAYTKVPEFALAFGNTGLKINLSLIAKDVDADGNLIFDDREGMPHKTAFDLRNRFSKNVGTIIVVFTDEQLMAAMADSRIDYIIPFHRSQWKKGQYNAMGLPKGTKDYTYMQNEKFIKPTYHEYRGKMVRDKAQNYMPNEIWDFNKTGKENAELYLERCYKDNKRPKFYKLLDYDGNGRYSLKKDGSTDGYWKLLIDFKMYDNDGVASPQMPVTPTFEMDEAKKMLDEYKGGHQSYPVSNTVVDKFVAKYKKEHKIKYSYRGQNAKLDNSQISVAMDMESKGATSDQIRQETGWFRGLDGKWRIEIDDSKMTVKSFDPYKTNLMLNDVIEHKELFDAYPQLNDVWFGIDPTMSDDGRTTGSGIVLKKAPTTSMDKRILLHEIQHLIQYIEGFAIGSNQNMFQYDEWDSSLQEALDRRNEYASKLYAILRRNGQSIPKEEISENQYFNTRGRDSIIDEHYFLLSNLAEKSAKTNQIWEEYWKATRELVLSTPYGKYMNTAGEIEAYDVQARANMSAEERKAMRPNVDIEGTHIRYSDRDSQGRELSKEQQEFFKDSNVSLDFDDVDAWFESLSAEEFQELIGDSLDFTPSEIKLSKQERRDAYVSRLYKEGKLDELITKLVKSKPQMAKYFANTQMNQKYNPLSPTKDDKYIVMFHGSPRQFNVFDTSKIGTHGTAIGSGIYFTENLSYAESYKEDGGRVIATLLNIEKPLSRSKLTISKPQLKTFIRKVVDPTGEDFLSNYGDVEYEGYETVLNKAVNSQFEYNKNDADLIESIYVESRMDFDEFHNGLTDLLGYDGIIAWNKAEGTQAIVFKSNQAKDIFNFNPTESSDIRYQTRGISNRTLLATALESVTKNEDELKRLSEYRSKVETLDADTKRLAEVRAEIKELSFGKGARDTERLKRLKNEATKLENRISIMDKQLLRLETTTSLKNLLEREKAKAFNKGREEARETGRNALLRARESRDIKDIRTKLQREVLSTIKWLTHPSKDDVKCPDVLKVPYAEVLQALDFSSKRSIKGGDLTLNDLRFANALNELASVIEKVNTSQDSLKKDKDGNDEYNTSESMIDAGYLDLPSEFVEILRTTAKEISKIAKDSRLGAINLMTSTEIKDIYQMIKTLNHSIKNMAKLYSNLRFSNVVELGNSTIESLTEMGKIKREHFTVDFVRWDNALPYYAFKKFGEAGESIFTELMDAQDKLAFLSQEIFNFKKRTWTNKEAREWSKNKLSIDLPSGQTIELTVTQAMGIYCLSRREQAMEHMIGGGIRVVGEEKATSKEADVHYNLTSFDIAEIVNALDERQKTVAQEIQKFMSTYCAAWGNEISMKRFLTRDFTEEFYYPIESNQQNLETKDPKAQQSDLFRLLNISATKSLTKNANNEIMIRDIFDVFVGHASDMAKLNAYGMALLDYMKWINYQNKVMTGDTQFDISSVKRAMEDAYGSKAFKYVINLIKDVNGRYTDSADIPILMKWTRRGKAAAVGANLRVVMLQFTSYGRASMVLSNKSLALGLTKVPQISKAKKYCGIALWKSFGFYDTNIARSIEEQVKGAKNVYDKIMEISMKGAEWADAVTWGALWNACEYEVAKTTKNEIGSEEFNKEVGLKLREVVYSTQVVDSILTRSQLMRSKSGLTQLATAFMSEPTLTTNILSNAVFDFVKNKRISGSVKVAWQKSWKHLSKAIANYCVLQIVISLVESLADAWRDGDDEKFKDKFLEAFKENVILNLVPFNKIPLVSDVVDAILSLFGIGYFSTDRMDTTWLSQTYNAIQTWTEIITEKNGGKETSKTVYNGIYQTIRALSSITGIPMSGAMRELVALWNNTGGNYDPTLKLQTYENSNEELGNLLYDAIVNGNSRKEESISAEFESQEQLESALKKALRTKDARILEAALALYEGDYETYAEIYEDIVNEGNFDEEIIKSAITSEKNRIAKEQKKETETEDNEETEEEEKQVSKYSANDVNVAFENGDGDLALEMIKDLIDTKIANGIDEKSAKASIKSTMTSYWKPLYVQAYKSKNNAEMERIRRILLKSNLYGRANDVIKTVNSWLLQK